MSATRAEIQNSIEQEQAKLEAMIYRGKTSAAKLEKLARKINDLEERLMKA